jgi:hypothetical protein
MNKEKNYHGMIPLAFAPLQGGIPALVAGASWPTGDAKRVYPTFAGVHPIDVFYCYFFELQEAMGSGSAPGPEKKNKGNYPVKYDMTFSNFVINQMGKVLEEKTQTGKNTITQA